MKTQISMGDTSLETDSAGAKEALRVLIAYNDLPAARRAMRVLADLDRGLGDSMEFQPLPWPFELLTDVDWRDAALSDAVKADILIIAMSAPGPLPAAMERWVEFTTSRKRGTDAAVIALLGSQEKPDDIGSLRLAAIRTAAQRTGLDFFAPAHETLSETGQHLPQHSETIAPLLNELLHDHHPPPHWGINE